MNAVTEKLSYEFIKDGIYSAGNKIIKDPLGSLSIVGNVACYAFKCYALYSLYEAALSDILCLKTFRHGTDPYAFVKIHLTGPDLKRGGTGGEARWFEIRGQKSPFADRDGGRFYVVQDYFEVDSKIETVFSYITHKLTLKYYALRSTVSYYATWLPLPASWKAATAAVAVYACENVKYLMILGISCASVKFHLDPDNISYLHQQHGPQEEPTHRFQPDGNDSDIYQPFSGACFTTDQLSVSDIGICGILKNGLNRRLPYRIWHHKGQFAWGVAQLIAAVAMTAFFFPTAIPHGNAIASPMKQIADRGWKYMVNSFLKKSAPLSESLTGAAAAIVLIFSAVFVTTQF